MGKKRGRPSKAHADTTTNDAAQSTVLNGQNSEPASQPAESSVPQQEAAANAGDVSTKKRSKKQKNSDDTTMPASATETTVDQGDASVAADVSTKKKRKKEQRDDNNGASETNGEITMDGQATNAEGESANAEEKKKKKRKRKHAEMDAGEAGPDQTAADASVADDAVPKKKRKKSKRKSEVNGDAEGTGPADVEAPSAESQAETDGMVVDGATTLEEPGEKKKKSKGDKKEKKEKKEKKSKKKSDKENAADIVEATRHTEAATEKIPATQDTPADGSASESPAKRKAGKKDKGKGRQTEETQAEQPAENMQAPVPDEEENFDLPPPLSQPKVKGRKSNVITPTAPGETSTPVAATAKRPTRATKVAPSSLFNDLPGHPEASTSTAAAPGSSTAKKGSALKHSTQSTGGTVRIGALPDLTSAKKTPAPKAAKTSTSAKSKGSAKKGPSTPALDSDKVAEMLHVKDGVVPVLPKSLNSEAYQETLATKWLTPKEIAALVEEGMRIRSGKYSNEEDAVIKSNINSYRQRNGMSEVEVVEAIISKDKEVRKQHYIFWTDLARALRDRPLMSIYHHVTRLLAPTARQGSWSAEEDANLKAAVDQYGLSWEKIAVEVGRWSGDCRDRWRNYISAGDSKATGKWSQAEEDKLRECVRRVKEANEAYGNVDAGDTEIFWTSVSKAFGGTRTRHQCRIKWTDNMANKILTKEGDKVRWSKRDAFIFITKLASLGLQREDDIEWGLLPDPDWNWWSGHTLQRRWATLRTQARTALDDPKATFPEMIKYLKGKQDAIPREEVKAFMSIKPGEQGESDVEGEEEEEATPAPKKASAKKSAPAVKSSARTPAKKVLSKEFVSESEDSAESGDEDAESE